MGFPHLSQNGGYMPALRSMYSIGIRIGLVGVSGMADLPVLVVPLAAVHAVAVHGHQVLQHAVGLVRGQDRQFALRAPLAGPQAHAAHGLAVDHLRPHDLERGRVHGPSVGQGVELGGELVDDVVHRTLDSCSHIVTVGLVPTAEFQ